MNGYQHRIVIIDDEIDTLELHIKALGDHKYEVDTYDVVQEALEYVEREDVDIDLLILDMMMPVPTGLSAAELDFGARTGGYLLGRYRC